MYDFKKAKRKNKLKSIGNTLKVMKVMEGDAVSNHISTLIKDINGDTSCMLTFRIGQAEADYLKTLVPRHKSFLCRHAIKILVDVHKRYVEREKIEALQQQENIQDDESKSGV